MRPGFCDHCIKVREHLRDAHGVGLTLGVKSLLHQLFQVAACNLSGEMISDGLAGTLLLRDPGGGGKGDPHGPAVHVEADIDCVSVTGGDGDAVGLPTAVQVFAAPAVGYVEIFVHATSVNLWLQEGKRKGDRLAGERRAMDWPGCAVPAREALMGASSWPIRQVGESTAMQVTVTVSDEIVRQAADHGMSVVNYVESLVDKGLQVRTEPVLNSAIARIRALRAATSDGTEAE